jgi:hypothetical protein
MRNSHHVAVVADDRVDAHPSLYKLECAVASKVFPETFLCVFVEGEPIGTTTTHFSSASLEKLNDKGGNGPLLEPQRRVCSEPRGAHD